MDQPKLGRARLTWAGPGWAKPDHGKLIWIRPGRVKPSRTQPHSAEMALNKPPAHFNPASTFHSFPTAAVLPHCFQNLNLLDSRKRTTGPMGKNQLMATGAMGQIRLVGPAGPLCRAKPSRVEPEEAKPGWGMPGQDSERRRSDHQLSCIYCLFRPTGGKPNAVGLC